MGLRANDKIRLRRTVEMYQWKEDKTSTSSNNVGGGDTTRTTYTYAKAWSETPVNSSAFKHPEKHENGEMDLRTQVFTNSDVALGDRQLGAPLLDQMSDFVSAAPPQTPPSGYQTVGRRLYKGDDADKPAVGDVRVTFAEGVPRRPSASWPSSAAARSFPTRRRPATVSVSSTRAT